MAHGAGFENQWEQSLGGSNPSPSATFFMIFHLISLLILISAFRQPGLALTNPDETPIVVHISDIHFGKQMSPPIEGRVFSVLEKTKTIRPNISC